MAFLDFLKALLIPLTISAVLYFVVFYFALPLYRRHRARYSQYLPLSITNSSAASSPNTASARSRITDSLLSLLSNFRFADSWLWLHPARSRVVNGANGDDSDEDEEPGTRRMTSRVPTTEALGDEELDEAVWIGMDRPRGALNSRSRSQSRSDSRTRLSVDLEQGFRDSSEDEED